MTDGSLSTARILRAVSIAPQNKAASMPTRLRPVYGLPATRAKIRSEMAATIETREFSIDDYEAALDLWNRVGGLEIVEADAKDEIEKFLSHNQGLSRVATDGRTVVGAALCSHDRRRGHIYHVAVDPAYHGHGIGKRLVAECLEGLRRAGLKRALILVASDNPQGQEFWRRCGWEDVPGAMLMGIDL
jgi:ribosomal protein S18 acetylase RimI-like enzyme